MEREGERDGGEGGGRERLTASLGCVVFRREGLRVLVRALGSFPFKYLPVYLSEAGPTVPPLANLEISNPALTSGMH